MTERRPIYRVSYLQDEDGIWCARASIGGHFAYSNAKTIPEARRRIRASIGDLLDVKPDSFELEP